MSPPEKAAPPNPSSATDMPGPRKRLTGLARMLRYRLVIPIARGRHNGVPTARGTAVGLFFGLTPTVGIQMPMIMGLWAVAKLVAPRWKFNLIVALAWTWPTNVVTAPLYYYLCLITGQLMLGQGMQIGFDEFQAQIQSTLTSDAGFFEAFWVYATKIFSTWGVALFVGCIPWTLLGTWLGYVMTLKFLTKLQARQRRMMQIRRARMAKKHAQGARATQT